MQTTTVLHLGILPNVGYYMFLKTQIFYFCYEYYLYFNESKRNDCTNALRRSPSNRVQVQGYEKYVVL